jgi:hypothetical protein
MRLEGCCLPGQHGRAHGVLDLPLQIVSHEVPSPPFTIGFYTLVAQLFQLILPMLLHSWCIQKPTTTPNTKSWMWDGEEGLDGECLLSLHVYPWMFFHPIGMYNLHPNDPIAFIFSPVIPLAKFKSMGKNTKVLWLSEQCQEIECFRSV